MESENENEDSNSTQLIAEEIAKLASQFSVAVGGNSLSYNDVIYKAGRDEHLWGARGDARMEKQNKKRLLEFIKEMSNLLFYKCLPVSCYGYVQPTREDD